MMHCSIEIGVKENSSTTEKGEILENLTAKILKIQQYDVVERIRVTGMEIDVLATHKVSKAKILVECKAWDNNIQADVISKLLGNVYIKSATAGWLITTGPLSKDAEGIKHEWESKTDSDRGKLSFYTPDRIIQMLYDACIIKTPEEILASSASHFSFADSASLLVSDLGMHWLIPVIETGSNFVSSIVVYNAKNGMRIADGEDLSELKQRKNSFANHQWLAGENLDEKITKQLKIEYDSIVKVISGDDWTDYRPARAEDFVGRKNLLTAVYDYFDNVINNLTEMRLFSIKAPSGMGKSSVVLKIADIAKSRRNKNKVFVYAVDVRTAISTRYVEMALKSCFDEASKSGFIDTSFNQQAVTNINQFMESDGVNKTLEYLRREKKLIVLIFDQFEELLSKKALWGLFESVRQLSNIVDSQKNNLILGFAWKTDLNLPAEHPAYYLWASLVEHRKEFDVIQFQQSETKSALKIFGNQLGEKLNPILSSYLAKQCQGYPWLLKKLCIHVFSSISEGDTQETIIGKKLNIIDLFEKDLSELTPEEHSCVQAIAENTPADYFFINEKYSSDVIQSLQDKRIVIRRATKLSLYWDIFNDYVLNGTTPSIILDYIPQYTFTAVTKVVSLLLNSNGHMETKSLCIQSGFKSSTIDNLMIDLVMFGIAKRENGIISLVSNTANDIARVLQNFFKSHAIFIEIHNQKLESFDYKAFREIFLIKYSNSDINEKTKNLYCAKIFGWFKALKLLRTDANLCSLSSPMPEDITFNYSKTRRRNRYSLSESTMFWGQAAPQKMLDTFNLIENGNNSYANVVASGLRNALELLSITNGIIKDGDIIIINKSMSEIFDTIVNSSTIQYTYEQLKIYPHLKGTELGELLNNHFSRDWAPSSKQRYGNALLIWVRYLIEHRYLNKNIGNA